MDQASSVMRRGRWFGAIALLLASGALLVGVAGGGGPAAAQGVQDPYAPSGRVQGDRWVPNDAGVPTERSRGSAAPVDRYERAPESEPRYDRSSRNDRGRPDDSVGRAYERPDGAPYEPRGGLSRDERSYEPSRRDRAERDDGPPGDDTYESSELLSAGHKFFGSVSRGLARAVESVVSRSGRPNGYILGEDAGGAFVAGLRYGEGRLYTKRNGQHAVYWQGPTLGYDFGGEGSKVMVLVYNLRDPSDIYRRFGGVQGSAYLVGGISVQFQKSDDILLAPIRAGVGLRIGANVGYLKYTRRPTWNPF